MTQFLYQVSYGNDYGYGDRHGQNRQFLSSETAKAVYDENKHGFGPEFYCSVVVFKADESGELHRVTSVCAAGDTRQCNDPNCHACLEEGPPSVPDFPEMS